LQALNNVITFVGSLRISGVKAIGKVGLSLEKDFFKTVNYDILYETIGSYLSVRNFSLIEHNSFITL
jgi:hypothetical protein